MKRKLANARAQRILAAARREFARAGFDAARMDRLARAAGVNKQLLFYYFQSKRGLFNAVLLGAAAELEAALDAARSGGASPLERVTALVTAQFDFFARQPDVVALLTHSPRVDLAPFATAIRRLVVPLAEGQGRGQVRGDLDPHLAAAQALVLLLGYLRLEPLIAASAPPLAAQGGMLRGRWVRAAVDLFVEGVRAH